MADSNLLPIVAIVGRPNVGKSTLFNRLVGGSRAIVRDEPGITRDRHYGRAEFVGRNAIVVDTGGFLGQGSTEIDSLIRDQVDLAIGEALLVVLVVDTQTGLTPTDRELAQRLRRVGKDFVVVANKVDDAKHEASIGEAHELGADHVIGLSATHGRNVADLVDVLAESLGEPSAEGDVEPSTIRLAIVGRPNAGKSSLLNTLTGSPRAVVHEVPGTTRDPVDVTHEHGGSRFLLVDTAGIRRRTASARSAERVAILRAVRAIARADVCALVVDSSEGISTQDSYIAGRIEEAGRAMLVVMNKWDLAEGALEEAQEATRKQLGARMPFFPQVPVSFVSAKTGFRVRSVFEMARDVRDTYHKRIGTAELNRFLESALERNAPPSPQGRGVRLYYATQASEAPPRFVISTNRPADVPTSYRRYLVNQLRSEFGFWGTPIRMVYRKHRPG